jgi:hypothetical protein
MNALFPSGTSILEEVKGLKEGLDDETKANGELQKEIDRVKALNLLGSSIASLDQDRLDEVSKEVEATEGLKEELERVQKLELLGKKIAFLPQSELNQLAIDLNGFESLKKQFQEAADKNQALSDENGALSKENYALKDQLKKAPAAVASVPQAPPASAPSPSPPAPSSTSAPQTELKPVNVFANSITLLEEDKTAFVNYFSKQGLRPVSASEANSAYFLSVSTKVNGATMAQKLSSTAYLFKKNAK